VCGRFTLSTGPTAIAEHFGLDEATLSWRRWGLVPSWSKDAKIGNRLINARAETAAEKPSFRSALRRRRCLVPADGFYEWAGAKGAKQPYFIGLAERALFAFAGLWERWNDPAGGVLESCTLLTTEAAEHLRSLHERMPVIVDPVDYRAWMDPEIRDPDLVFPVIARNLGGDLAFYPVSKRVNDVKHDDRSCLEAIAVQTGIF